MMRPTRTLWYLAVLAVMGMLVAGAAPGYAARPAVPRIVYVALGDSLTTCYGVDDPATQCYPALLGRRLPPGSKVFDDAVSGADSVNAAVVQVPTALRQHPSVVTIFVGGRDFSNGDERHFKSSLDRILSAFQHVHARVFVATLPNYRWVPADDTGAADAVQERPFNADIRDLGARHGATVVDLYGASRRIWGTPSNVFTDGLHLTPAGQKLLAALFYQVMHSHGAL